MTRHDLATKLEQLTELLSDELWHSGEDLSNVIGWRFGSVIHQARHQGIKIETRRVDDRWEYRLSKASTLDSDVDALLSRITTSRKIFGGKPIVRGRHLAVEHVLGCLAAGDTYETLLAEYPWIEPEDIQACLLYAQNLVQEVRPGLKVEELVDSIPDILEQAPYLTLLVLFGSRARDDADTSSDWDFAFLCDEEQRKQYEKGGWDSFRMWGILQDVYDLLDDQIDVVEMKNCSEVLAHQIAKDGQVVYEQDSGIFASFQERALMSDAELQAVSQHRREKTLQTLRELKT